MASNIRLSDECRFKDGWAVDASEIGFRPGAPMPDSLVANNIRFFYSGTQFDGGGDFTAWTYKTENGLKLVVFND